MNDSEKVNQTADYHTRQPRVLVIEHERDVGLGAAEELLRSWADLEIVGPDQRGPIPQRLEGFDALIVLGGSADPDDDLSAAWLPAVRTLIDEALRIDLPLLGICLGAQLIGRTAGAALRRMPAGPEIGVLPLTLLPEAAYDPLLQGLNPRPRVAQWHWFETELPAGAVALARSESCRVQAFRLGSCAWGLQFHPEVDDAKLVQWALEEAHLLRADGVNEQMVAREAKVAARELDSHRLRIMDNLREIIKAKAQQHKR